MYIILYMIYIYTYSILHPLPLLREVIGLPRNGQEEEWIKNF